MQLELQLRWVDWRGLFCQALPAHAKCGLCACIASLSRRPQRFEPLRALAEAMAAPRGPLRLREVRQVEAAVARCGNSFASVPPLPAFGSAPSTGTCGRYAFPIDHRASCRYATAPERICLSFRNSGRIAFHRRFSTPTGLRRAQHHWAQCGNLLFARRHRACGAAQILVTSLH
jgi:hypothetical protein